MLPHHTNGSVFAIQTSAVSVNLQGLAQFLVEEQIPWQFPDSETAR